MAQRIQTRLTQRYVEKGYFGWARWREKAIMRLTGVRPRLARGETALPAVERWQTIGLSKLKVAQLSWEITHAPRMGGVWVRGLAFAPAKAKVLPHLFFRGGKLTVGYLAELRPIMDEPMWKRGLLPYVTQKQVTRMGIVPYVPKVVTVPTQTTIHQYLIGFAVVSTPKFRPTAPKRRKKQVLLLPKVWQEPFTFERERLRTLAVERLVEKQKRKVIPVPRLKMPVGFGVFQQPITKEQVRPKPATITVTMPKQVTTQITIQPPTIPTPQPTPTPTPFIPFYRPRGGRDISRRQRALFGKWFKREHPIKTPSEMLQTFMGRPRKRKKRRRRVKEVRLFGF